jgi:hypothetical protein
MIPFLSFQGSRPGHFTELRTGDTSTQSPRLYTNAKSPAFPIPRWYHSFYSLTPLSFPLCVTSQRHSTVSFTFPLYRLSWYSVDSGCHIMYYSLIIEDYPKSLLEFEKRFSSEDPCRECILPPKGFRCRSLVALKLSVQT